MGILRSQHTFGMIVKSIFSIGLSQELAIFLILLSNTRRTTNRQSILRLWKLKRFICDGLFMLLDTIEPLLRFIITIPPRLATVRCSNLPNPHRTCTEPKVQCSVQLPSRTDPAPKVRPRCALS